LSSGLYGGSCNKSDIAGHYQALAVVPTGTIEDYHGMGIAGDLGIYILAIIPPIG
jgi:hypothetical protein